MKLSSIPLVSLKAFIWLVSIFFLHRLLTYEYLLPPERFGFWRHLDVFVIGFLSDLWVAAIGTAVVTLAGVILSVARVPRWVSSWSLFVSAAVMLFLVGLHQPYVEFFRYQVLPHHLAYFNDFEFIAANNETMVNFRAFFTVWAGVLGLILLRWLTLPMKSPSPLWSTLILGFGACAGLHSANIHYRVQHFVPESLQNNLFERLYRSSLVASVPPPIEAADLTKFGISGRTGEADTLRQLVTIPKRVFRPLPAAVALKKNFRQLVSAGERPIISVVLLESHRPSEMGIYGGEQEYSPYFSLLSERGVFFLNAFATGATTRNAQESVWCGHLSTQFTSMMRERPDVQMRCLPDQLGDRVDTFWHHGGRAEFDGQVAFWRARGVSQMLSQSDFVVATSKTGWGVSDAAMFKHSFKLMRELHQTSSSEYLLGMLLSVTNHIPWTLPSDAPDFIAHANAPHPAFLTTLYADWSLNEYVKTIQSAGLWDRMIMIVLGDHGTGAAPANHIYTGTRSGAARILTHIPLMLIGGLVEKSLADVGRQKMSVSEPVSQAAISGFIHYLIDAEDSPLYAMPLLAQPSDWPVVSDTGKGLLLPQFDKVILRRDLMQGTLAGLSEKERRAVVFYRAYLHLLNQTGLGR